MRHKAPITKLRTTWFPGSEFCPDFKKERVKGIEPSCAAWEAAVLPLNYTRMRIFDFRLTIVIGSLKQFKSSLVGECRFAIHSARCARSGQVLQAANNHCHEITSSSFVPVFLFAAGPGTLWDCTSLPNDHAITPI